MVGIGLMMIVKDEAHVIRRCLESARDVIDWWVVADTGSTDGTQELVKEVMAGVPGELVERPWVDFGHNRQEVLDLARASTHRRPGDHAVWIDADEYFTRTASTARGWGIDRSSEAAGYHLQGDYGETRYARLAVIDLDQPWRWVGPIHEYLDLPGAMVGSLDAPGFHVEHAGARSLDPTTYRRDAEAIERALRDDPTSPRLRFYLAQSWRDAGELERSLEVYRERSADRSGWEQERWYAVLQVASLLERLGSAPAEVVDAYLDAHDQCPWRAEPLVELARFERGRDRFSAALLHARAATTIPVPGPDALFVDVGAHTWRAWDEVAVSCYWTARWAEGVAAAERALTARPDDERLKDNLMWCRRGMAGEIAVPGR